MSERFVHASIYVGGRRVGQINNAKYRYSSGDEPQIGDSGYAGHSDGASMTSLTCTAIQPTVGMDVDLVSAIRQKKYLDITLAEIAGKKHQVTMRCTEADFTSDVKSGTLTGDFTFGGGPPKITG